ncbi:hypothetical protein ISN44_As09g021040 [Arabidopsis suecica]|uniref:Uncharacterized protein n=1 Tax=Arabidopsis suecica TaxID=45249 RepID=A0A8T2AM52_ARASU|nr:hypothetical protein ISN44_As09g021040 [Arabidopsis suecica]
MMVCKSLVMVLIFVSLFGLHQCRQIYPPDPKGIERCFSKFMGEPFPEEFWCGIEDPSICFPEYEPENCLRDCPPLRKGGAPSPSPGATLPPL